MPACTGRRDHFVAHCTGRSRVHANTTYADRVGDSARNKTPHAEVEGGVVAGERADGGPHPDAPLLLQSFR